MDKKMNLYFAKESPDFLDPFILSNGVRELSPSRICRESVKSKTQLSKIQSPGLFSKILGVLVIPRSCFAGVAHITYQPTAKAVPREYRL